MTPSNLLRDRGGTPASPALSVIVSLSITLVSGCCGKMPSGPGGFGQTQPTGPAVDIGVVSFPTAYRGVPTIHDWTASKLKPNYYKLGYALEPGEKASVDRAFSDYAKSVRYERTPGGFRWNPPKSCAGVGMQCVYEELARRNWPDLAGIADKFKVRGAAGNLTTLELTSLVVTFVQDITYEVPNSEPFGVMPPSMVISESKGDCDSKALLGHILLSALGMQTVMLSSQAHSHAMLGIALPITGTKKSYQGRDYAFTEMTAKGSPLGYVSPKLLAPDDWRVIPTRLPVGGPK